MAVVIMAVDRAVVRVRAAVVQDVVVMAVVRGCGSQRPWWLGLWWSWPRLPLHEYAHATQIAWDMQITLSPSPFSSSGVRLYISSVCLAVPGQVGFRSTWPEGALRTECSGVGCYCTCAALSCCFSASISLS